MRASSWVIRFSVLASVLGLLAPFSTLAQTFAATTGTDPVIAPVTQSAILKANVPKHASENLLYGRVRDGVYTVDGMVAKVQLNYDVNGVHYLYMFVPGIGTAVIAAVADPDAVTVEAKLEGNNLSFSVGDHRYMLTGVALATSKGSAPEHLFVRLDRAAWRLNRRPMLGFGDVRQMPYQWPGALATSSNAQAEESQVVPPMPASLLPSTKKVIPTPTAPATAESVSGHPVTP